MRKRTAGLVLSLFVLLSACATQPRPTPAPSLMSTAEPSAALPTASAAGVSLDVVADRAAHTATTLGDGTVFVAGGCVIDGCGTATADTFLVARDASGAFPGPPMSTPRDGHTATLSAGDVFLVGGFSGEGEGALSSIDVLHGATGILDAFSPLVQARGGHAAAALGDGTVLVVGGWIRSRTYTASVEIVDPATGSVSAGPDLPWAADALDAISLIDGRALVTGGQVQSGVATNQAAIYNSGTHAWQSVGPMLTARLKHTQVLLGDGRVLVMGGSTNDEDLLATTELFDPNTLAFTAGPDMHEPRYKMPGGALAVDANRVLIGGGGRSLELLDLASGTSRVIDTFAGRGSFTTVSVLGDQWLVIGGYDDRITLRREFLVVRPADLEEESG